MGDRGAFGAKIRYDALAGDMPTSGGLFSNMLVFQRWNKLGAGNYPSELFLSTREKDWDDVD